MTDKEDWNLVLGADRFRKAARFAERVEKKSEQNRNIQKGTLIITVSYSKRLWKHL